MKIPVWAYAVIAYLVHRPKGGESAATDIPPKPAKVKGADGWTPYAGSLATGTRYFARLVLHGTESLARAKDVQEKFESLGFSDVHVWMDGAPKSWPGSVPGPFVLGTWGGPLRTVFLPGEIVECWVES